MDGSQETVKAEYIGMMEGGNQRHLQRIESVRILDHPVLISQSFSGTHPSHHHHNHHHQMQPNEPRIFAVRSFGDDYSSDTLPLLCYHQSNGPTILAAQSFDGDFGRIGDNDRPYHSTDQNGRGLPPRPPHKLTSHQLPSRPSIAPRRPPDDARSAHGPLPPSGRAKGDRRNPPLFPRHAEGDRSGRFPRVGDRPIQPRTQPRRSSSMSRLSPEGRGTSSSSSSSRPRMSRSNTTKNLGKSTGKLGADSNNAGKNKFSPQRSPSIHRRFDKNKIAPEVEGDVWVERIIVNGTTGRKTTYFKSVHGKVVCKEPPTGAKSILYLEDIIDDRQTKTPSKQKPSQPQSQPQDTKEKEPKKKIISKPFSDETDDDTTEAQTSNGGKKERIKPKRSGSFFRFMKKDRKSNKADADGK
eukprot:jgi/Psemu1/22931/gm1.22931_g